MLYIILTIYVIIGSAIATIDVASDMFSIIGMTNKEVMSRFDGIGEFLLACVVIFLLETLRWVVLCMAWPIIVTIKTKNVITKIFS